MPKNIVLCSDGTGNRDIKGRGTNVFKLFEAVDLNGHRTNPDLDTQLAFYDDGVGTGGNPIRRLIGGAAGLGLKSNVKELYRELSRVYDEGDSIFLFGFSRGAFTVRTLAGMIGVCGVLKGESFKTARALKSAVEDAYETYRATYDSYATKALGRMLGWPDAQTALANFRHRYALHSNVAISFIGVWDTVDAVGLPFATTDFVNRVLLQFKFPTQDLGRHVQRACHALSIDDQRIAFEPVLWNGPDPRIQQVWFSGVHSNVGGGYPKQGMSLVALDWMLGHAEQCGLRLVQIDRELYRSHACVDDLLYDSRSGLGVFYRWAPRDIREYCRRSGIDAYIHLSVAERIAHATDDYAPGNVPPGVSVVTTPLGSTEIDCVRKEQILAHRASAVQATLRTAIGERYLLSEFRAHIAVGTLSYLVFVMGWILVLLSVITNITLVFGMTAPLEVWLYASAIVAFLAAGALSAYADNRMSDGFSLFWQQHQKDIRAALKHAKSEARALEKSEAGALDSLTTELVGS
jgi:uncharacterized protein (DUF2235 family)